MLADFQQAMADLTASPRLCNDARRDPGLMARHYTLSPMEARRLQAMVEHPGMACACIVYRANRLAPLALNLRATCAALGPALRPLADAYWAEYPEGNVHFYIESARFCDFVADALAQGAELPEGVAAALAVDRARVRAALAESRLEARRAATGA